MSNTALYKKLSSVQLNVSQALVRETVSELRRRVGVASRREAACRQTSLISSMAGEQPNSLPGYKLRIIDGTARLLDTYHNTQNKS